MWPDFVCPWKDERGEPLFDHYFYYTKDVRTTGQVEFSPLEDSTTVDAIPSEERRPATAEKGRRWRAFRTPLHAFVGRVGDARGILLVRQIPSEEPIITWKVGIDFGSTHTSIFYAEAERRGDDSWERVQGAEVKALRLKPRTRILTHGEAAQIQENFFLWARGSTWGANGEALIPTQLIVPVTTSGDFRQSWLPREGIVFLGSVLDGVLSNKLDLNLKWNKNRDDHSTRAFLRSLVILIEAEALGNRARVASIAHSYPTAFPNDLAVKHNGEWSAIRQVFGINVEKKAMTEASAVCRHLLEEQEGRPQTNLIAVDIGGSTSDYVIWADSKPLVQESIKMAAGAVSRYFEHAPGFATWYVDLLRNAEPFRSSNILPTVMPSSLDRRVFHATLQRLTDKGLLDDFIEAFKTTPEARPFLWHIVVIFAALTYYAGLLTRKVKLEKAMYYLFYCGKGGQFVRWIPFADAAVREWFTAGFRGPEGVGEPFDVKLTPSKYPKQEVGRGLLISRALNTSTLSVMGGIAPEVEETVTVGEHGYEGLAWSDNLGFERLMSLHKHIPAINELKELNAFVHMFTNSTLTRDGAVRLGLKNALGQEFRDALQQRLSNYVEEGQEGALIEPVFITEVKVLLESLTKVRNLFD